MPQKEKIYDLIIFIMVLNQLFHNTLVNSDFLLSFTNILCKHINIDPVISCLESSI